MARTAAQTDSAIIEAWHALKTAKPDMAVTGPRLQRYFGAGHAATYAKTLARLQLSGALPVDAAAPDGDPLEASLLSHVRELTRAMQEKAAKPYADAQAELTVRHQQHCAELELRCTTAEASAARLQAQMESVVAHRDDLARHRQESSAALVTAQARITELETLLRRSERELAQGQERNIALSRDHENLLTELTTLDTLRHAELERRAQDYHATMAVLRQELAESRQQQALLLKAKEQAGFDAARLGEQLRETQTVTAQAQAALDAERSASAALQQASAAVQQTSAALHQTNHDLQQANTALQQKCSAITQTLAGVRTECGALQQRADALASQLEHAAATRHLLQTTLSAAMAQTAAHPHILYRDAATLVLSYGGRTLRYTAADSTATRLPAAADLSQPVVVGERLAFAGSEWSVPLAAFAELDWQTLLRPAPAPARKTMSKTMGKTTGKTHNAD
jgi:DNA repair exonuclease SbcCD ATPase subunit